MRYTGEESITGCVGFIVFDGDNLKSNEVYSRFMSLRDGSIITYRVYDTDELVTETLNIGDRKELLITDVEVTGAIKLYQIKQSSLNPKESPSYWS